MTDFAESLQKLSEAELFQKVSDICATVNAVTTSQALLETSLIKIMGLFGAKRGSIFLVKQKSKDLVLKVSRGMEVKDSKAMVKRLGSGVVGLVAETKQPIFVHDIANDERFKDYKARNSYESPSFIVTPLMLKDKLIGVICVTDKSGGRRFSSNELQLLDFLSAQIALNYRRIQLFRKFKSVVKESKTLKKELGKSSRETDLLKKQVVLHERLASLGKLAGGIAHEFNNPLDGVLRYTNLCLDQVDEEDVIRGYVLEIKNGLNRMANIVKNLLACSRDTNVTMEKVDLAKAVEQVIQSMRLEILSDQIKVNVDVQEKMPRITDLGIERILENLIRNAIDSMEGQGEIDIMACQQDTEILLQVRDNGCGINKQQVDKIFDPFYTTKAMEKGCGLGLTIVSEIVKSYNGKIKVESHLNKGTVFSVSIPIG